MDVSEQETVSEIGQDTATDQVQETPQDEVEQEAENLAPEEGEDLAEEQEQEASEEAEEYAEIEIDGELYQVPAKLKDGYMKNADYTQKTQSLAEQRREVESLRERLTQTQQVTEKEIEARADLLSVQKRLREYQNADWNSWYDEDFLAAQKGFAEATQLEKVEGQIKAFLQQAEAQRTQTAVQEIATRKEQTREFAKKSIPGWTPETDAKVEAFATEELGFSQQELAGAINPAVYRTLHLAMVGHQAMKNGAGKKPVPKSQIKPLKTVSAKTGGQPKKNPSEMSMDEYAAYRNRQESAARARGAR